MKGIFARAYHDTFDGRFARTVFLVLGGGAFTYGVVRWQLGPSEAMLELPYLYAGVAGAFGPLLLLFLMELGMCAISY